MLPQVSGSGRVEIAALALDPPLRLRRLVLLLPMGKEQRLGGKSLHTNVTEKALYAVIVPRTLVILQIGLSHIPTMLILAKLS